MKTSAYVLLILVCLFQLSVSIADSSTDRLKNLYSDSILKMVEGEYGEAAKTFDTISAYADAADMAIYCKGLDYAEQQGLYSKAIDVFLTIPLFKDSAKLAVYYRGCSYQAKGVEAFEQKDVSLHELNDAITSLQNAIDKYSEVLPFKDTDNRIEICKELKYKMKVEYKRRQNDATYQEAFDLEKSGKYDKAIEKYNTLDGYLDSNERIMECMYLNAISLKNDGDYDKAVQTFETIGQYKDAVSQITDCIYLKAVSLQKEERYYEALKTYQSVDQYKDSKNSILTCKASMYKNASQYRNEGEYYNAYIELMKISDYEDSLELAESIKQEAMYDCGWIQISNGEYEEAYKTFSDLDTYKNSEELVYACSIVEWADMEKLSETIAAIKLNSRYGIVSFDRTDGIHLLTPQYDSVYMLNIYEDKPIQKEMIICQKNGICDLYSQQCKPILTGYTSFSLFDSEHLLAKKNKSVVLCLLNGEIIISDAISIEKHSSGLLLVEKDEKYLYDYDGQKISNGYTDISLCGTYDIYTVTKKSNYIVCYGLIDKTGKEIAQPKYSIMGSQNGSILEAPEFIEQYIKVCNLSGEWTWLGIDGKELMKPIKYKAVTDFHNGLAYVYNNEKWSLIDKKGYLTYFANIQFIQAKQELEAGNFLEAAEQFGSIEDLNCEYESHEMEKLCYYLYADKLDKDGIDEEAVSQFELLGDYEDSKIRANVIHYRLGNGLENQGKLDQALEEFTKAEYYKDSSLRIQGIQYKKGLQRFDEGLYDEAAMLFEKARSYSDAGEYLLECYYRIAKIDADNGKYDEAITLYEELDNYKESKYLLNNFYVLKADNLCKMSDYRSAIDTLNKITDTQDNDEQIRDIYENIISKQLSSNYYDEALNILTQNKIIIMDDLTNKVHYMKGLYLLGLAKYDDAALEFKFARDYLDASEMQMEAVYNIGWIQIKSGKYKEAYTTFSDLGTYKNSEEIAYVCSASERAKMEKLTDTVSVIKMNSSCGFASFDINNGVHLFSPQYLSISSFNEHLLVVEKTSGDFGIINTQNELIIPYEYDSFELLSNGAILSRTKGKCDLYTNNGELIVGAYEQIYLLDESHIICKNNGKCDLYTIQGQQLLNGFDTISIFRKNYLLVSRNNQLTLYNFKGEIVIPESSSITEHASGLILVQNNGYALYDYNGRKMSEEYEGISVNGSNGVYTVTKLIDQRVCYGLIDHTGQEIAKPTYCILENQNGSTVEAPVFYEQYVRVCNLEGEWTWLGTDGKELIKPRDYETVQEFTNGLADVCKNGKWSVIDKNGYLTYFANLQFIQAKEKLDEGKYQEAGYYIMESSQIKKNLQLDYKT